MKHLMICLLLLASIVAFAQEQNGQAPQITVLRYDTISTKDPSNPNAQLISIYNHNSGRLIKSGRVASGKKDGVWKSYYENGMLSRVEEFHNDEQNGSVIVVETTGNVSKDEMVINGVKNGMSREYNRNGTIKTEETYADGKLNGWRRVFGTDGKLQEEGNWKNGLRDSINRWAYPSGKIYVQYYYVNGNISGPGKIFYEGGNVKAEGSFSDGYESGVWKEFSDSTKKVIAEGSFTNGKKTGTWKLYNDDGTPLKTQEYDATGNLIKETLAPASTKSKTKTTK